MSTTLGMNYLPTQSDIVLGAVVNTAPAQGTVESWTITVPTLLAGSGLVNPSGVGIYRGLIESEIVYYTAGTATAGTQTWIITRGQESTTPATHANGTPLKLESTAGQLGSAVQLTPTAQQTGTVNVSGAITSGGLLTGTGLTAPHASTHDVGGADVLKDLTRLASGPASHGYIAWTADVLLSLQSIAPPAGVVTLHKIMTAHAYTINSIDFVIIQAGSGVASLANCFIGIYDSGGTRRFASADQSSNWGTPGAKSLSLGGSAYTVTANDFIYIALLVGTQATTNVKFSGMQITTTLTTVGLTAATYRYAQQLSSQSSLPSPTLTLASNIALSVNGPWFGVK